MISSKPATPSTPTKPETSQTATRKLVVGRGIVFSGEITSCDCLVVEGTVKANIAGCHDIDIAEGGLFTGSASVESAEIRGRFEGTLNVSGRLLVRATGRIAAEVRYHQIEIERGGEISGHIQAQAAGTAAAQTPTPLPRRA
jgi:cytoskeletal protein CcmA (bactofilin family)